MKFWSKKVMLHLSVDSVISRFRRKKKIKKIMNAQYVLIK